MKLASAVLFAHIALLAGSSAIAAPIRVSCGAVGLELNMCKEAVAAWVKKTGNEAEVVAAPNESTDRLALYQKMFASQADSLDVLQLDVVWMGMLANHLIDLRPHLGGSERDHFPQILSNNIVNRRLVAVPWWVDAGLLFYRKDLLQKYGINPPTTWSELATSARKIQDAERAAGQKKMWGFVWQGRAYEGLTCNALEWVASSGGGAIVDEKGRVTINNPSAQRALDMAKSWIGTVSPPEVLNYAETESFAQFEAGNAVFLRSWPYVFALGNRADGPIKGKIGAVNLPSGIASATGVGTLGGWQLGVSKYSRNPQLAASLAVYLTGAAVQKERAIKGAYNPSVGYLYWDLDVVRAHPHLANFFDAFSATVSRPSAPTGSRYADVSKQFWTTTHDVLSGKQGSKPALEALERNLNDMTSDGKWK